LTLLSAYGEASLYHDPSRLGYVAVLIDYKQHCYRIPELASVLDSLPSDKEVFISQCEFKIPSRRLEHLARLPLQFVDLDTQRIPTLVGLSPAFQTQLVLWHCRNNSIPTPSLINSSGQGVHLKWLLSNPPDARARTRWKAVQSQLALKFEDFGVDSGACNGSQCLRSVGSINPRSGRTCETTWIDGSGHNVRRWDFDNICLEVLPINRPDLEANRNRQRTQLTVSANSKHAKDNRWSDSELWRHRWADLLKLLQLRGWDQEGVPQGYRDRFLFVASVALTWQADIKGNDLVAEVEKLAREYCPSFSPAEIRSSTNAAIQKHLSGNRYIFTDEFIIELLDISGDECKQLKTIIGDELRAERHREQCRVRERKHTNRATYENNAKARRNEARLLKSQGLTYKKIAELMGTTVNAVDKLLRS